MEQESGTDRTEPSFGEDGQLNLEDNQVDLDRLFNEIDRSAANGYSRDSKSEPLPQGNGNAISADVEVAAVADEDELHLRATTPRQPPLDFGEDEEPSHNNTGSEQAGYAPTPEFSNGDESMSRGVLMVGGALAALGILLGAVGIYAGFSASSRIDALQQSVDTLQEKLATALLSGDPRVGQLQAEQAGLVSRLDEMALKVDEVAGQKSSDPRIAELDKRLDALEHKSSSAKAQTGTATKNNGNSGKPATSAASKSTTSKGDWSVVLFSTASVTQADSERTRLQKMGYQADVIKSQSDGKLLYRVRVLGYVSHDAAKAAIPAIEKKSGISGAWVAKR